MNRQTIDTILRGKSYAIAPGQPGSGLIINGIQLHPSRVIHYEHRVDIREGKNVAFIVEHPVAAATILGIHDAVITGTRETWDFYRASDREAHVRGLQPGAILGPGDGSIGSDIAPLIDRSRAISTDSRLARRGVLGLVAMDLDAGNKIRIEPARSGTGGLEITARLFNLGPIHATLDPVQGLMPGTAASLNATHDSGMTGGLNDDMRDRTTVDPGTGMTTGEFKLAVLRARSAAVIGLKEEALIHTLGDVVADLAGTGGIHEGIVDVQLGMGYHKVTIGLVNHLESHGLLAVVD
jgi:hypothetical protein